MSLVAGSGRSSECIHSPRSAIMASSCQSQWFMSPLEEARGSGRQRSLCAFAYISEAIYLSAVAAAKTHQAAAAAAVAASFFFYNRSPPQSPSHPIPPPPWHRPHPSDWRLWIFSFEFHFNLLLNCRRFWWIVCLDLPRHFHSSNTR